MTKMHKQLLQIYKYYFCIGYNLLLFFSQQYRFHKKLENDAHALNCVT